MRLGILSQRGVLIAVAIGLTGGLIAASGQQPGKGHPKLNLRTNPGMANAPAKILAIAELVGGADDDADYYCPSVEWTWGDDTTSSQKGDCDPYVPGKSTIERRISSEHRYDQPGNYTIIIRFSQGKTVVGSARATLRVTGEATAVRPTATGVPPRAPRGF